MTVSTLMQQFGGEKHFELSASFEHQAEILMRLLVNETQISAQSS